MADHKPVNPSAQKPAGGVTPRPAPGRARNAGPVRPGVTPANSPAAIPAVMRGPVAPAGQADRDLSSAEQGPARSGPQAPGPQAPGPEQRRKPARNALSAPRPDKHSGRRAHSAQGTAAVPKPPVPGLLFRPVVRVADLAAAIAFY